MYPISYAHKYTKNIKASFLQVLLWNIRFSYLPIKGRMKVLTKQKHLSSAVP